MFCLTTRYFVFSSCLDIGVPMSMYTVELGVFPSSNLNTSRKGFNAYHSVLLMEAVLIYVCKL